MGNITKARGQILIQAGKQGGKEYSINNQGAGNVRCRDMGSEESRREVVAYGGNEDVKTGEWNQQAGQN